MTDTYDLDYGELILQGERPVVRYTRHLPHPPEKVWRALTEPEHLEHWFPTTMEGSGPREQPCCSVSRGWSGRRWRA